MTVREDIAPILYALDASFRDSQWDFERLSEGWTNQSYKITHNGQPLVLRIANQEAHHLGVDRSIEYQALQIGMAANLAPELVAWTKPQGHSLTSFIEGTRWDAFEDITDDQLTALADIATRLRAHAFSNGTDLFQSTEATFNEITKRNIEMPAGAAKFIDALRGIGAKFAALPYAPVLCHNDINKVNIIEADQLYVIDWEYAGHGHPLMELARISVLYELAPQQDVYLLDASDVSSAEDQKLFSLLKTAVLISDLYWSILRLHLPPVEPEIIKAITSDIEQLLVQIAQKVGR